MSSLIEQAAQRLAQIRQAGIEIPGMDAPPPAAEPPAAPLPQEAAAPPADLLFAPAERSEPIPASTAPPDAVVSSRRIDLDLERLASVGLVSPLAPKAQIAEEFRVIKRPLINNAIGKSALPIAKGNLIMVTSALPGEGKTFNAISLAMSFAAELDHTVMLVDADVARPSVFRMLGLEQGPGLLDLLEGRVEMSNVLLRTNVEKLTLLPSGTPHPRATELLASDAMSALLADMATRYADRIIIFDSPPLLLTTESRVLATHMGQIVMVVHADSTLQAEVQQALSTIESCPVKLMVLNKARSVSQGGHGYGYGYHYGYGHAATAKPETP